MKRVLVRHAGKDGKSTLGKNIIQNIRHFYVSGKVRTVSGDVWNVKPVDHISKKLAKDCLKRHWKIFKRWTFLNEEDTRI